LKFSSTAEELSEKLDVELAGYQISATSPSPRITTVGLIQNKIVLPTDAPIKEQVIDFQNVKSYSNLSFVLDFYF